jgi:serine/threonine protein phosphatase PrpC
MFGGKSKTSAKSPAPNKPSVVAKLKCGYYEEIGTRPTLEDRVCAKEIKVMGCDRACFFGVYDGHGGKTASAFLEKKLHGAVERSLGSAMKSGGEPDDEAVFQALTTSFEAADAELNRSAEGEAGSTCSSLLLLGNKCYAANVGDSRVVLCRGGVAVPLTKDQKPGNPDEKARIKAAGGFVMNGRVLGSLAVARAFGDREFKGTSSVREMVADGDKLDDDSLGPLVIPTPEVHTGHGSSCDNLRRLRQSLSSHGVSV